MPRPEYEYQEKNYLRNKALHEKQLISDTEFEESTYNYAKAKSAYESSEANLAKAKRNLALRYHYLAHRRGGHQPAPVEEDRPLPPDSKRLPSSPLPPTSPRCR